MAVAWKFGLAWAALSAAPVLAQDMPEPDHAPDGYVLVFSDEFTIDGPPDPAKWDYDTHRNKAGWYNDEAQYYARARAENSRVEGGVLIIEARQEKLNRHDFADLGGQKYTSARLMTKGRAAWTYGFYEIRAKLPCGVGTWPAIWMLPEKDGFKWPDDGEIDIMEHVGFAPGEVNQTVHTKAQNHILGTEDLVKTQVPTACGAMHRYQLLWTPDYMVMSVDDVPRFGLVNNGDPAIWPFDQPMHLLLNIAVGGGWGGQKGIKDAAFPATMEVDYVRVYQPVSTP
jgi:beta-glucanase (GH16 family)